MPKRTSTTTLSRKDFDNAKQIRDEFRERLVRQPIYQSARAIYDKAEACAGPETTNNNQSPSAVVGAREAMRALKENLSTIRSHNSSYFKESVPVTKNESCIRALISSDIVNEHVEEAAKDPETTITVNVRPQNTSSFESRRDVLLENTGIEVVNPDDKDEKAMFIAKVVLNLDMTSSDNAEGTLAQLKMVLDMFLPKIAEELNASIKVNFVPDPNDKSQKQAVITVARYSDKDPFEKLIHTIGKKGLRRGSSSRFEANTSAPDVLRLATLRFELPHNLNDWLINNENQSAATLFEGMRIAFEAIVRDDTKSFIQEDLAEAVLEDFEPKNLLHVITPILGMTIFREAGVHIHNAPIELLFAKAVKDISRSWRTIFRAECQKQADSKNRADEIEFFNNCLGSTFPEEVVATMVNSLIPVIGFTPAYLFKAVMPMVGGKIDKKLSRNGDEQSKSMINLALAAKNLFGGFGTIEFLSPSASIQINTTGIDGKFLQKMIPNSVDELVEYSKPFGPAFDDDLDLHDEKMMEEIDQVFKGEKENASPDDVKFSAPDEPLQGWYGKEIRKLCKTDFFDDEVIDVWRLVRRGLAPFTVVQKPVKIGTQKSSWDFGDLKHEPIVGKQKPKQDTDEDKEEEEQTKKPVREVAADSDDADCISGPMSEAPQSASARSSPPRSASASSSASSSSSCRSEPAGSSSTTALVAKVEQVTPKGVNMVTCGDCGARYNACLPAGHTCLRSSPPRRRGGKKVHDDAEEDEGPYGGEAELESGPSGRPLINNNNNNNNTSSLISPSRKVSKNSKNRLFDRLGGSFVIPTDDASLREIFNSFDQNGDGSIDKKEFVSEYTEFEAAFGVPITQRDIEAKFRRFDRNNDGVLSYKEFCYFMVSRAAK